MARWGGNIRLIRAACAAVDSQDASRVVSQLCGQARARGHLLARRLVQALTADGTAPHSGLTWTIDAPFRQTVTEARSYQAEGVVCVEMEAAALFTVGRYRGVDVAAASVISDHLLAEDRWTHAFGTPTLRQASSRLLDAALHTLSGQELPTR